MFIYFLVFMNTYTALCIMAVVYKCLCVNLRFLLAEGR